MLFYPSKAHNKLQGAQFTPEIIDGRVLVNPKYPIKHVLPGTLAVCDSGAFQDIDDNTRLQPRQALERQLRLEAQILFNSNALTRPAHLRIGWDWHFEAVVIYDQMAGVDEALDENGRKVKKRGTVDTAALAVAETLRSARYYASQRDKIAGALCFVGQGVTPDQYVNDCVVPMLELMHPGDWFAFGGFCILGKVPSLLPVFYKTYALVLPILKSVGITRIHLLGVCVPDAVRYAAGLAGREGFTLSTDSSAPEVIAKYGYTYVDGRQVRMNERGGERHSASISDLVYDNIRRYTAWAEMLPELRDDELLEFTRRAGSERSAMDNIFALVPRGSSAVCGIGDLSAQSNGD